MITYNHEKFIADAIEGVVNQKCDFPFELIIGEDCSTDRTREICLEYQKKYPHIIRLLISKKNVGGHYNSLRCTNRIRGKYVAFCEGDDYWTDMSKLQKQVDLLEAHPEIGLCVTDYTIRYEEENTEELFHVLADNQTNGNLIQEVLLENNWHRMQTAGVMIRAESYKSALKKDLIFYTVLQCGDTQMMLNAVLPNGKYYNIPQNMYTYRRHRNGACFGTQNYQLILDGFLIRFHFHRIICKEQSEDLFLKYFFLGLPYRLGVQNKAKNIFDSLPEIEHMVTEMASAKESFPLASQALKKTVISMALNGENYFISLWDNQKLPLHAYAGRLAAMMQKGKLPLWLKNNNMLYRILSQIFPWSVVLCLNRYLRKIISTLK